MSLGFNSDVTVGEEVCHVQTEDHGRPQCRIETLVYHRGRILHRRNSSYSELPNGAESSENVLVERVQSQHRSVIEELRHGAISIPSHSAGASGSGSQGIQVRLRNANSWLAAGQATLDVQVLQRADSAPVPDANIEAYLSGATANARVKARTGADGLAQLRFAVPNLASNGAELVIRADAGNSAVVDEIRFTLRVKPKTGASPAKR